MIFCVLQWTWSFVFIFVFVFVCIYVLCFCAATDFSVNKDLYKIDVSHDAPALPAPPAACRRFIVASHRPTYKRV